MRLLACLVALAGCGGEYAVDGVNEGLMQCPTSTVEGVDVYQGDGTIDWAAVNGSGRLFAFAKASQGDYNSQTTFATNWSQIKAAGMYRGPYHFFDATVDGVAQANWFLGKIAAAGGVGAGDLPPALDLECPTSPNQADTANLCLGNGKNGWVDTATLKQRVWDFLDTVEKATGMTPIIYSYVSWFGTFGFTDAKLANYPLWIASYDPKCATIPAPWTSAPFWQYTATGAVPGIGTPTTNADHDRFTGTAAQLAAWVAAAAPASPAVDAGTDGMVASPDMSEAGGADMSVTGGKPKGCSCEIGGASGGIPIVLALLLLAAFLRNLRGARAIPRE
jgi:lysozyme